MARPHRPLLPGATYHLTDRGNRGQIVFVDDRDRRAFLSLFRRISRELGWLVYGWCLLGNHYHLLVQTPEPNLHVGMQRLNGGYVQRFHRRHGTRNHLWQGRYHSELVLRDEHLLECFRYIAFNPVRAHLCATPTDWRWSSHRQVLGHPGEGPLDRGEVAEIFAAWGGDGLDGYVAFTTPEGELPPQLIRATPKAFSTPTVAELVDTHGRAGGMEQAFSTYGYTTREIAKALGCSAATVVRTMKRA
jgi:putative transposase